MDPASFTAQETIEHAADLLVRAHALGMDAGEWAALVAVRAGELLAERSDTAVSARDAALSNRPGSWEAALLGQLIDGTPR